MLSFFEQLTYHFVGSEEQFIFQANVRLHFNFFCFRFRKQKFFLVPKVDETLYTGHVGENNMDHGKQAAVS